MLAEFQQAFADLVASPELCIAVQRDADILRRRYQLTDREVNRLVGIVAHPGMAGNCTLYRANRLAPLAVNLPDLVAALGPHLREMLDAFWAASAETNVHFYLECHRFCLFVRDEIARGRALSPEVERVLPAELARITERLEASHTEIYSPLRAAAVLE